MTGKAEAIDLGAVEGDGGVVWSVSPEGFHANLVVLAAGDAIAPHRNDAVDVLMVVLAGSVRIALDDQTVELSAANALLLPRGAVRGVTAGLRGARYLSVHAQRRPLSIGARRAGGR